MGSALGCVVIHESTIGAVEYLGKYDRMIQSGCYCINPCFESVAHRISLKTNTVDVQIETVTKESLSVTILVSVQYKINNENIAYINKNVELDEKTHLSSNTSSKRYDVSYQATTAISSMYEDPVYRAIYTTANPLGQMNQFINSYFRTISSNHTMKELFASKNKLSNELTDILNHEMNKYGYFIHTALIADIDPPAINYK
jgi:regulator of protease activity HflC (stomatin/prohibitin superfamily)